MSVHEHGAHDGRGRKATAILHVGDLCRETSRVPANSRQSQNAPALAGAAALL